MDPGTAPSASSSEQIGRYTLVAELAAGGMATIHLARFQGEAGFSRTVVVKRLHPQFAKDPDFVCMFLDEARLASRVRHPNVVSVHDVVSHRGELLLAMDYVHGASLSGLVRAGERQPLPLPIALALGRDMLAGLHAAHETSDKHGHSMQIVHRDVSPQNLMVGADGVGRVVDFGIASASARLQTTGEGQVKGKLSYMAPEQIRGQKVDRRVDVFAAGIVLWQLVTGQQFATGPAEQRIHFILSGVYQKPTELNPDLPPLLDEVIMRALHAEPSERYATAEDFARALVKIGPLAPAFEISTWVRGLLGGMLEQRAELVRSAEHASIPPPALDTSEAREEPHSDQSATRRVNPTRSGRESPTETMVLGSIAPPAFSKKYGRALGLGLLLLSGTALAFWIAGDGNQEQVAPAHVLPPPVADLDESVPSSPALPLANSKSAVDEKGTDEREPTAAEAAKNELDSSATEGDSAQPRPAVTPKKTSVRLSTTPRAPKRTAKPAPKAADPCSPPYVLLEGGVRKYKSECL